MKIINITICIFIVILSIVIFNVFINCKSIHENFDNIDSRYIGEHYILPDTKSILTTNVHYTIDPLNNEQYKLIENQNNGFRCGNERDNYYFINLNPGSSDSNFNLLYDPVLNGKNNWTSADVDIKRENCKKWFKHNDIRKTKNRDCLEPINQDNETPIKNLEDALDKCSRDPNCIIVSDNTNYNPADVYDYLLVRNNLTYDQHVKLANQWGGNIVWIENKTENDYIRNILHRSNNGYSVFLGGQANSSRVWKWDFNGDRIDYSNWNNREPNNAGGREDVIHMLNQGTWNDIPRTVQLSAIYKRIKRKPRFEYLIETRARTFEQHRTDPPEGGWQLASIESFEENLHVQTLLRERDITVAWLGGRRQPRGENLPNNLAGFPSGKFWHWIDGSEWNWIEGFTLWQPDNWGRGEEGLTIGTNSTHTSRGNNLILGSWNDAQINSSLPAVYKRPIEELDFEYRIDTERLNFDEHRRKAIREGWQLASIRTIEENNKIIQLVTNSRENGEISSNNSIGIWLGGQRRSKPNNTNCQSIHVDGAGTPAVNGIYERQLEEYQGFSAWCKNGEVRPGNNETNYSNRFADSNGNTPCGWNSSHLPGRTDENSCGIINWGDNHWGWGIGCQQTPNSHGHHMYFNPAMQTSNPVETNYNIRNGFGVRPSPILVCLDNDTGSSSHWSWIDGTPWDDNWIRNNGDLSPWGYNQPDNHPSNQEGQNCLAMFIENGKWDDWGCQNRGPAVYKRVRLPNRIQNKYQLWSNSASGIFSIYDSQSSGDLDMENKYDLYNKVCIKENDIIGEAGFNTNYPLTIQRRPAARTGYDNEFKDPCINPNGDFGLSTTRKDANEIDQYVDFHNNDIIPVIRYYLNERRNDFIRRNKSDHLYTRYIRSFFPLIKLSNNDELFDKLIEILINEIRKNPPKILTAHQTNRNLFFDKLKISIDDYILNHLNKTNRSLAITTDNKTNQLNKYLTQ